MTYEIAEFIVNNRNEINAHLEAELAPTIAASRIFDNNPQLQIQFLNHRKLIVLRDYIANHFSSLNPEDILLIDKELINLLKGE